MQYVGGSDHTIPWNEAPTAVSGAMALIQQRTQAALGKQYQFNEILSCAYMEKQKMAVCTLSSCQPIYYWSLTAREKFHSDAERGLGPVVASLSLGSMAFMHFRLLAKYDSRIGKGTSRNALTLILRHVSTYLPAFLRAAHPI